MKRYLLNSPILTAFGTWEFEGPISVEQAQCFLGQGSVQSAIGHDSTARRLSEILGIPITARRVTIAMDPGDEALVFRLRERLAEGVVLAEDALAERAYDFGVLKRIS